MITKRSRITMKMKLRVRVKLLINLNKLKTSCSQCKGYDYSNVNNINTEGTELAVEVAKELEQAGLSAWSALKT